MACLRPPSFELFSSAALSRVARSRVGDPWPQNQEGERKVLSPRRRRKPPRRLDNSEVRSYSWACLLVFVREWINYSDFIWV